MNTLHQIFFMTYVGSGGNPEEPILEYFIDDYRTANFVITNEPYTDEGYLVFDFSESE